MCYFLDDNLDKGEYLPLNVEEETAILYDFKLSSAGTPPMTPFLPSIITPSADSPEKKFASSTGGLFGYIPDIEVINPTPEHSPYPSPPMSQERHCPFSSSMPPPVRPNSPNRSSSPIQLSTVPHSKRTVMPLFTIGPEDDDQPLRKTSVESYGSRDTETASTVSITASESDWSEDGHSTSGVSMVTSPSIKRLEAVKESDFDDSLHTLEGAVKRLEEEEAKEQEDHFEDGVANGSSHSVAISQSQDGSERERRSLSTLSNQSLTSEESGEEDGGTPTKRDVRYVRPRSTSIKEIRNIFEAKSKERRTGLTTTGYLPPSK